jgi:hypothetical protein
MQRRGFLTLAMSLAAAVGIVAAQEKAEKLSGRVNDLNKNTMTITMHTKENRGVARNVVYDANTKFTLDGKEANADAVKSNFRIVAQGKFDGANLKATQVDLFTR